MKEQQQIADTCARKLMTNAQFFNHIRDCQKPGCAEVRRNHQELAQRYAERYAIQNKRET